MKKEQWYVYITWDNDFYLIREESTYTVRYATNAECRIFGPYSNKIDAIERLICQLDGSEKAYIGKMFIK